MSKHPPPAKIKQLFAHSVERLRGGDAAGAAKGFEKLVKVIPDSAVAWYNLGLSRQHLSRHAQAISAYQQAARMDPSNADCLINLGLAQKELGQADAAMENASAALKIAPRHPRALNLVGTLLVEKNEHESAGKAFRDALEMEPGNVDARYNLANCMRQSGAFEVALEIARPLLGKLGLASGGLEKPAPEKRHRLLFGQILLDLKRYGETLEAVRELKREFPHDDAVLSLEMAWCEATKEYFGVIDIARELLKTQPDNARVWNALGSAYFQLDGIAKAADCYRQAIELDPEHAEYQNNHGLAHSAIGDKSAAEGCYRKALQLQPGYAEAYRNLVAMKKFSSMQDADAAAIERMWKDGIEDDFTRAKIAFALGKVYDDVGEYAQAFAAYDIGNRLKFAESKLDFDQYFTHIDSVVEVFTERPQRLSEAIAEPCPIFILGMPRSGTTLVEQILSRHSQVSGCGELPCIEKAIARMEKRATPMRVYPRDFLQIQAEALGEETRNYLAWVKRLHALRTPFFTDKMPFNFVHLWLIKTLFPDAAIVHCHRHPLDVILSNYFQLYASDVSFVYDLGVLARYYARYYRLMRHWRQVFGDEVHTVQYEALVGDKETETRRLIAAAHLPWDDACLDLKKSDTAVRTASIWQVRQGIYTTSRERWRNYVAELAPAIEILQRENVLDAKLQEAGLRGIDAGVADG